MRAQLILGLLVFGAAAVPAQRPAHHVLTAADSGVTMREGLKGIAGQLRNLAREDRRSVRVRLDSTSVGFGNEDLRRFVRDSLQVEARTSDSAEYRLIITELWRESDSTAVVRVRLDRAREGQCPTSEYAVVIVRRGGVWEKNVTAPLHTAECPHLY